MAELDARKLRDELASALGAGAVDSSDAAIAAHAHDTWPLSLLRAHQGTLRGGPACVVSPRSVDDVATLLRYANRVGAPVTPFGAGSGVCGGVLPSSDTIVVDLRQMNRLLEVDETSLTARVQAGMMGDRCEAELNERGYSMGHLPQSIALSTVGGWVATRAAGQFSTRYGSIEDILLGLQVVLPDGRILNIKAAPRRAAGPDLRHLFLGAEGTLGIVTELTARILPLPESRVLLSFAFADFDAGLEAIRRIVRAGWRPPVVRLYDAAETERHFGDWAAKASNFLILMSEGPTALTAAEAAACTEVCSALGGRRGGRRTGAALAAGAQQRPQPSRTSSSADSSSTPSKWRPTGIAHPRTLPRGRRRRRHGEGPARRLRAQLAQLRAGHQHLLHLRRPAAGSGRRRGDLPRLLAPGDGGDAAQRRHDLRTTTASADCAGNGCAPSTARAWRCCAPSRRRSTRTAS